ncbi:hypothetical protein ACJ73_00302 [Blastomyces percursus]|uniref:Uncharacterized protein n=1 Tax=Blastomyces percursus TaxID=1658174 RepID=A0A1J9R7B5_9EURO|nr:hypothetical protein ACJ73_00302 [Blastomyces percursus]
MDMAAIEMMDIGYDEGGDYSYDEPYNDSESCDTEDYTGSSYNRNNSPSYDYGTDGASEGNGPRDAEEYPRKELEVDSDEATYSSGSSCDGSLQAEAESSYRHASVPSGSPYRSTRWGG